jgi:hypothetical protein
LSRWDTFAVSLTVRNDSTIDLPIELKTGFRLPDSMPINFAPLLQYNKHFEATLPVGVQVSGTLALAYDARGPAWDVLL